MEPTGDTLIQNGVERSPITVLLEFLFKITLAVIALSMLIFFLDPPGRSRPAAPVAVCINNLKQVAFALNQYRNDHGLYPPVCLYDAEGRAAHSWRTLILPQIDQQSLYEQYRFDEPWNGVHNSRLNSHILKSFCCRGDRPETLQAEQPWLGVLMLAEGNNMPPERDGPIIVDVGPVGRWWSEPIGMELETEELSAKPPHQKGFPVLLVATNEFKFMTRSELIFLLQVHQMRPGEKTGK